MNDGEKAFGAAAGATNPIQPNYQAASAARFDMLESENGFNYVGEDSLGHPIKGFVQTTDPRLAENELERAGIKVESIVPRRGIRKRARKPTPRR